MKTVLVTGGAGFIGSHLCDYLVKQGNEVVCVDNLVSGFEENIAHLKEDDRFTFINHDIIKPLKLEGKIDEIYNLASIASPIGYQLKPIETLLAGSHGVKNMLDLAIEHKAKFLQASTSEVYGDPLKHPQKESYWGHVNSIGLRSCYDESKRFAEALIMAYHRQFNVDSKLARIFNTYGPRMAADDGRVVPAFIEQALNSQPLTVFGKGSQTRSFCFIDDMVEGLYLLMQSDYNLPVNLGNPQENTILELAEIIIKLVGCECEIVFKDLPEDDPLKRQPDISLAKKLLNWEPQVKLDAGLRQTIKFFAEK